MGGSAWGSSIEREKRSLGKAKVWVKVKKERRSPNVRRGRAQGKVKRRGLLIAISKNNEAMNQRGRGKKRAWRRRTVTKKQPRSSPFWKNQRELGGTGKMKRNQNPYSGKMRKSGEKGPTSLQEKEIAGSGRSPGKAKGKKKRPRKKPGASNKDITKKTLVVKTRPKEPNLSKIGTSPRKKNKNHKGWIKRRVYKKKRRGSKDRASDLRGENYSSVLEKEKKAKWAEQQEREKKERSGNETQEFRGRRM